MDGDVSIGSDTIELPRDSLRLQLLVASSPVSFTDGASQDGTLNAGVKKY